jgi:hypothetical protein
MALSGAVCYIIFSETHDTAPLLFADSDSALLGIDMDAGGYHYPKG